MARDIAATDLTISADGTQLFARDNSQHFGQVLNLQHGSRANVRASDFNFTPIFSADKTRIYQLQVNVNMNNGKPWDIPPALLAHDINSGKIKAIFDFSSEEDHFYGAFLQGDIVTVESKNKTWHLDSRNLQIISVEKQNRPVTYAILCPDSRTLYDVVTGDDARWEFTDLESGKLLWQKRTGALAGFSVNGQDCLWQEDGEVIVCDTRTGAEKWRLRGPQSAVLALSPDENAVFEARSDGKLWRWPR